ncbi:T9SS type A sorting domain-containing protein [Flavobacterium dankookense]|uniref:Putative secreted protein (Por secretion system target) n=1 Tax=Flavobacterium dankookense TaxID=706186 RepID=A0A4R6Q893_9FLAO|nr:T9SS type A sorting domain-containing protein [Flavobacterium dankookense]TDP58340.1 putative secreted protein (Por secretion system target) [Flavobacterium dankookense]
MKTTKIYLVVCLTFLLTQFNAFSQYNGGVSDGATLDEISATSCSTPAHFYAYFGGNNDGASVDELSATTCGFSNFQYAYFGGVSDGAATEELSATTCGIPPSFFAYFGGNSDGAGVETLESTVCGFPPQFYAYFGGNSDGFSLDATAPICPTQPPVASFTASTTALCVGQSVTFTDTSTNIPFVWNWTITGATPSTSTVQNPTFTFNSPGTFTVVFTATNYNGSDTVTFTDYITVTAIPVVNSTTPASRCDAGTVTLQAAATLGTLNWYDAPTGGNLVGTGTSFTTPSISATTTYYVQSVVGSCTSTRVSVVATVNNTPTITSTTPAARCGTGNITLLAIASSGTIQWYDLPSGGTLLASGGTLNLFGLSTTTTYYVQVTNGFCTSSRTPVIATINAVPTVTSTTPATRCDAGSVTLQALASSGTLNWYDAPTAGTLVGTGTSFTTPSISTTTTYYVEATSGTCNSARTAVTATVNVTPSITSTTPGNRCDTGSVTLFASANAGTLNWYNAPTGGTLLGTGTSFTTPSISATTTYYVEAVNGSCTSVRTSVVATVNASPTISSTTPASICSGDAFNITAVASSGTVNWYNSPTGGTLLATGSNYSLSSLSTTTIFYAQAIDGSCSSVRTPVEVTVTNRPTNTSSTPASRCGNGSVTLSATFSSGTVNWYDAPVGGTLVGTGFNFTTPSLSATTSYFAEATNGVCTSLVRTSVTATINEIPVITSTTPASRCGDGSVTLQATASIGTINWYNAPTGGTLVATGGSFTTPILGTTTIYYVEVVNGGCNSARTAVNATVFAVATITSTSPASRCDAGTLTLNATSNIGTLNWYNAPSGGTLLATGTSFTTPVISNSTTYYVEATNGSCTSSRVAVTASINTIAAPTGFANQTFCAGETVGLILVTGSNVIWYDSPTGGNIIPNGTALVSGTTYYASQTLTSCESPTRLAVTMTLGGCLGIDDFEKNNIKIYPNPTENSVTISSTQQIKNVEVVNLLGQSLFVKQFNSMQDEVDLSKLPTATYLLKISDENGSTKISKVIKK